MTLFIEYLVDIGVIVNNHSISTNNVLFSLSDYLKNLSASDSFDMAIRLYDAWKLQQVQKKNPSRLIKLISHLALKQPFRALKCLKNNRKTTSSPTRSVRNTQKQPFTPLQQNSYQSPTNTTKLNQMGFNDTCERLYMEGMALKVKKEQLELEKSKLEMKDCTFKPSVSQEQMNRNDTEVFDRLYRTQLIGKNDYSEVKSKQEVSQCTFTPVINKQGSISNFQPIEQIFDRLYQESVSRSSLKQSYAPLREQKELEECTFKPQISQRQQNRSNEDIFKRLHNESAEKQQIQAFQRIEKETKELQKCTFKPQINTSGNYSPCSQPAFDRLYMLSTKTKKTLEDSQQKQKTVNKTKDTRDQSSINNESLYERMKNHVNQKKRHIHQIKQELDKELTFKPNINIRQSNNSKIGSRNQSIISVRSEPKLKPTANTLSTYVFNTRKSQQDKENSNLSMYCETAYFQEDQKVRFNIRDLQL